MEFGGGKVGQRVRAGDVPCKGVPEEPAGSSFGTKLPLRGVDGEAAESLCSAGRKPVPFPSTGLL